MKKQFALLLTAFAVTSLMAIGSACGSKKEEEKEKVDPNGTITVNADEKFSIKFTNETKDLAFKYTNSDSNEVEYSYPIINLNKGDTLQLKYAYNKLEDSDKNGVEYSSKYSDIVTVDGSGLLTANKEGLSVVRIETVQEKKQNVNLGMGYEEQVIPASSEVIVMVGNDNTEEGTKTFFKDLKDFEGGYDYTGKFPWSGFDYGLDLTDPNAENTDWTQDKLVSYDGLMNIRLNYDGTFCQYIYDELPREGWIKDVDKSLPESTVGEASKKYGNADGFPAGMLMPQEGNMMFVGDDLYLIYYHEMTSSNLTKRIVKLCATSDTTIKDYRPIPFFADYSKEVVYNLNERKAYEAPYTVDLGLDEFTEIGQTSTFKLVQGRKVIEDASIMYISLNPDLLTIDMFTGLATAVGPKGTAQFMCMYNNGTGVFNGSVKMNIPQLEVENEKVLSLINDVTPIKATLRGEDVTSKVEWVSEDEKVAKVDTDGKITAIGEGETFVKGSYDNRQVTIKVTVRTKFLNFEEHMAALNIDYRLDGVNDGIEAVKKDNLVSDIESKDTYLKSESQEMKEYIKTLDFEYVVFSKKEVYDEIYFEMIYIQLKDGADFNTILREVNSKATIDIEETNVPKNQTFKYDKDLNIIYRHEGSDLIDILNGNYVMTEKEILSKDKTVLFSVIDPNTVSYTVPKTVTKIGNGAFQELHKILNIEMHDNITTIGNSAFYDAGAFDETGMRCTKFKFSSGIKVVEDRAFRRNDFSEIVLNEGLETIGAFAFKGSSFKTINFPSTLRTMARGAFWICNMDGTVDLSKTQLTVIPDDFIRNSSVEIVILPEGITKIGKNAFAAAGVDEINIPSTVTSIGENAFYYEPNYAKDPLTNVYIDSETVLKGLIDASKQIENIPATQTELADIKVTNFGGVVANVQNIYVKDTIPESSLGEFFKSKNVYKDPTGENQKEGYVKYLQKITITK